MTGGEGDIFGEGGEDDDEGTAELVVGADEAGGIEAIHDGHHEIEEDHIGQDFLGHIEGFLAVGGEINGKTILLQKIAQEFSDIGLIVCNQNRFAHATKFAIPPTGVLRKG